METKPKISIVTPSYNQGQFIEDAILSVKNQDYPNFEHIYLSLTVGQRITHWRYWRNVPI